MNLRGAPFILVTLALLGGCVRSTPETLATPEKPPRPLVQKIEARLAQEACVGSLSHWSRHYSYSRRSNSLDKQLIWIDFIVAGYQGKPSGISIDPPRQVGAIELDDRPDKPEAAYGEYNGRQNAIRWWCDANDPSPQPKSLILPL